MSTTASTNLGQFLQAGIAILKSDALAGALPIINGFFQKIQANSSISNITAEAAALQVDLMAALPNLEQQVAKDLAALVQQEVNALVATVNPASATAANNG